MTASKDRDILILILYTHNNNTTTTNTDTAKCQLHFLRKKPYTVFNLLYLYASTCFGILNNNTGKSYLYDYRLVLGAAMKYQ